MRFSSSCTVKKTLHPSLHPLHPYTLEAGEMRNEEKRVGVGYIFTEALFMAFHVLGVLVFSEYLVSMGRRKLTERKAGRVAQC